MTAAAAVRAPTGSPRRMLLPLALARFICSFAGCCLRSCMTAT